MVSDAGGMGISQVLKSCCWFDGNGHILLLVVVTLIDCSVTRTHEALKAFLEQSNKG